MPETRYFLAEPVLTALFALRDHDCQMLLAVFDQIAEDPRAAADSMGRDWDGRSVYVMRFGQFEIGYLIAPNTETVTFTLLRPRRN